LCANKSDKKSVVSEEEIREWASKHNLKYFETSALTGSNVSNMFITLFEKVLEKIRAVP
jgi:signal recognition particle receptor subunit beta